MTYLSLFANLPRLSPYDYGKDALYEKDTRALMEKITLLGSCWLCIAKGCHAQQVTSWRFSHGGPEYDAKYPDGIPTAIDITLKSGKVPEIDLPRFAEGFDISRFFWGLFFEQPEWEWNI